MNGLSESLHGLFSFRKPNSSSGFSYISLQTLRNSFSLRTPPCSTSNNKAYPAVIGPSPGHNPITTTQHALSPLLAICNIPAPTAVTFISPGTSGKVMFLTVCRLSMNIACSGAPPLCGQSCPSITLLRPKTYRRTTNNGPSAFCLTHSLASVSK